MDCAQASHCQLEALFQSHFAVKAHRVWNGNADEALLQELKAALNWLFRRGRSQRWAALTAVPPLVRADGSGAAVGREDPGAAFLVADAPDVLGLRVTLDEPRHSFAAQLPEHGMDLRTAQELQGTPLEPHLCRQNRP